MCEAHGLKTNARRQDPTQSLTIQDRFEGEAYRRFRELKGKIRREIEKEDGFGLKTNRGRFDFPRDSEKVSAFMDWLREQQQEGVLGVQRGVPVQRAAEQAWTRTYIERAYQQGVGHAARNMRGQGVTVDQRWVDAAFNREMHADRVGIAYTRAYQQLQGITEAMDQAISRELASGIAQGLNPRDIARNLNNRVDSIGIARARTMARTEVVHAHAEASLNAYEEAGIEGVETVAEWSTAGDDLVCPICEDLEGTTIPLNDAHGIIPIHPNCRCAWLPKVVNGTGIELR